MDVQTTPSSCEWLSCWAIIKFDIEIGQTMEYTFPSTIFTEEEASNICFLSFPDSNSCIAGDIVYSFKTKRINRDGDNDVYLYGYVFFRQEKDPTIARGYLQKSVVLLTPHAYVGLYKKLVSVVGPMFFEFGTTLLEASYRNIACWPSPQTGKTFELPILGTILTFHVPFCGNSHIVDPIRIMSPREQLVSNLQSINIYSCFRNLTHKLWLLWELVLTGEPLLVMSPDPPQCSDAVLGLVSLISPLRYCGDFRPYFTIHDSDFKELTSTQNTFSAILGVTNPFFLKALAHWPHVVTIGTPPLKTHRKTSGTLEGAKFKLTRDPISKHVADYKQSVNSSFRGLLDVEKRITKQLLNSNPSSPITVAVNNELLRRHFLKLSETFLIPLERYFSSLMPLAKSISLFHRPPRLKPFNQDEFLQILSSMDKYYVVENKAKELELYKRFLASSNFTGWFADRRSAALTQLNSVYRRSILDADIPVLLKGRSHVEIVDLYMRMRDQLILEEAIPGGNDETAKMITCIRRHLEVIMTQMPQLQENDAKLQDNVQDPPDKPVG